MSIIKLQITEDHLKLVKVLNFSIQNGHLTTFTSDENNDEKLNAFGYEDLYDEIGLILYGKPENFDPMGTELVSYSEEQKEYMDSLWSDMPIVLELKCFYDTLIPGTYKRKFHNRNWTKI